ncbi:MAG: FHA domain-containing protein [Myxococcaceae bacterium]|nr:FHA domain-containing protein [Myxococcaceae bacterium]
MAVPSFWLSILKRQALMLGDGFTHRYANDWLVWEAGLWMPATSREKSDVLETVMPGTEKLLRPTASDAVCYALWPDASRRELLVGRATTNDLIINDLTVSRVAFRLVPTDGWRLEPESNVSVTGAPEGPTQLTTGQVVRVGDVRLTYLTGQALLERLRAPAAS